jgi:hypothetical protein
MAFADKKNIALDGSGRAVMRGIFAEKRRRRLGSTIMFASFLLFLFALLPSPCTADSITLAWDENAEPNIAGYRIYYRIGSSGSQIISRYNGTGIENGDSPIDLPVYEDESLDPRFVEITLEGLNEDQEYYFVVTAYNTEGLESAPSNEAALLSAPEADDSGAPIGEGGSSLSSGAVGGGGGGCFISSVWK